MTTDSQRSNQVASLAAAKLFAALSAIILNIALTRLLDPYEYGLYHKVLLLFLIAAPFLTFGLSESPYFFLPGSNSPRKFLQKLMLIYFAIGAGFCALILGLGYFGIPVFSNPKTNELLLIVAPYALVALPMAAATSILSALGRSRSMVVLQLLTPLLTLTAVTISCWFLPFASTALLATVWATGCSTLLLYYLMLRGLKDSGDAGYRFASILKYSLPLGLTAIVGQLSVNLDKLIVSIFSTTEEFAIYVTGAVRLPLIAIVAGSVYAIIMPELSKLLKVGRKQDAFQLWQRSSISCALVLIPAMVFLAIFAEKLIVLLFTEQYRASSEPFRIYLLLLPVRSMALTAFPIASGHSRQALIASTASLIGNGVASYFLVRWIGPVGAAIGTLIGIYVFALPIYLKWIEQISGVNYFRIIPLKNMILILLVSICTALPFALIDLIFDLPGWSVLLLGTPIYALLVLTILNKLGFKHFPPFVNKALSLLAKKRSL